MSKGNPVQAARPTEAEEAFDASNPEQVTARNAKAKLRDDLRRDGLRYVMGDRRGRAWMRHLLSEKCFTRVGKIRPAGIFTGNSTTFYNAALKELGDVIAAELAGLCPAESRLMEDEGEPNAG